MKRDIIVIGASAGGVYALKDIISALPEDFDATVFVVLHTSPYSPSKLPEILTKAGKLKAEAMLPLLILLSRIYWV